MLLVLITFWRSGSTEHQLSPIPAELITTSRFIPFSLIAVKALIALRSVKSSGEISYDHGSEASAFRIPRHETTA